MQRFVSEMIENARKCTRIKGLDWRETHHCQRAIHDEYGASISDLLQIVMVSPQTHLVQNHESQLKKKSVRN